MKKVVIVVALVLIMAVMVVGPALAAPGGMPAAHGLSGAEFGAAVSDAAPVGSHASGGNGGGMPAAHGLSGAEFGAAVSAAAPVSGHVNGK